MNRLQLLLFGKNVFQLNEKRCMIMYFINLCWNFFTEHFLLIILFVHFFSCWIMKVHFIVIIPKPTHLNSTTLASVVWEVFITWIESGMSHMFWTDFHILNYANLSQFVYKRFLMSSKPRIFANIDTF